MALTTTTLSSAVVVTDNTLVVASATGAAAGTLVLIDQEQMQIVQSYVSGTTIPVVRGQGGTATAAHPATANVTFFLASDEVTQAPQTGTQWPVAGRGRVVTSYSAAGAITLPSPGADAVAILNGTSALAMTLANPTKDMDGCILHVVGNGKAAHTITYTAGLGNAGSGLDVGTFATGAQLSQSFVAANGIWCGLPSIFGGTQTANTVTWA